MTVKEIIVSAAKLLRLKTIVENIDEENFVDEDLDSLLYALNLVYGQIASEDFPLEARQVFEVSNKKIATNAFNKKLLRVIKVFDKYGNEVEFKQNYDEICLLTDCNSVSVIYHYYPQALTLDGDLVYEDIPSTRVFALGVASEFCVLNCIYDEAVLWDRKFKTALRASKRIYREMRLPIRRWL